MIVAGTFGDSEGKNQLGLIIGFTREELKDLLRGKTINYPGNAGRTSEVAGASIPPLFIMSGNDGDDIIEKLTTLSQSLIDGRDPDNPHYYDADTGKGVQ